MTKNPFYNALSAIGYIVFIVLLINFVDEFETNIGTAQYVMPIMMLSMFTLSAAVMAYIFGYHPLRLFMDNKRDEGVKLFLKTVGIFGGLIFLFLFTYLLFFKSY
jgi:hypothetical protein